MRARAKAVVTHSIPFGSEVVTRSPGARPRASRALPRRPLASQRSEKVALPWPVTRAGDPPGAAAAAARALPTVPVTWFLFVVAVAIGCPSHAEDAVARRPPHLVVVDDRQGHAEDRPGVAGVDHAVVVEPGGVVERRRLAV